MLNRRDLLRTSGAAALACGLSGFPLGWPPAPPTRQETPARLHALAGLRARRRRSSARTASRRLVDRVWTDLAAKHGFEVDCTKDGRVFLPETLAKFDAFFFYTTGDLTAEKSTDGSPPMPPGGQEGACSTPSPPARASSAATAPATRSTAPATARQQPGPDKVDPYIAMLGGEFISHGSQQKATMRVVDAEVPRR